MIEKYNLSSNKIIFIGLGRHAKRVHVPLLKKFKQKYNFSIVGVVDLNNKLKDIDNYLKEYGFFQQKLLPVNKEDFSKSDKLFHNKKQALEKEIKKLGANIAIISCDDKYHETYIELCLKNNIHILIEKPLFTQDFSSVNYNKAKKLIAMYENIAVAYKKALKRNPNLLFSIISQRRYHPAFERIKQEVKEVYEKTNCPITHSKFYHSDGQWRMPDELLEETYHGYNRGIGKCSHSGYHFFDTLAQVMKLITDEKRPERVVVESNFVRPNDVLEQINLKDHKKVFKNFKAKSKSELEKNMANYGEVDASINYSFMRKGKIISFSDLILVHNGFSNRSWFKPNEELYKWNRRLRHENHTICQGPYQSIHFHSYQSDETKNKKLKYCKDVGGELHFEVHIFRNKKLLKTTKPQFEKLSFDNFKLPNDNFYAPRGHQEYSKYLCLEDFFQSLRKGKKTKSNYLDHYHSHLLYSLAYMSGAKDFNKKQKKVVYEW